MSRRMRFSVFYLSFILIILVVGLVSIVQSDVFQAWIHLKNQEALEARCVFIQDLAVRPDQVYMAGKLTNVKTEISQPFYKWNEEDKKYMATDTIGVYVCEEDGSKRVEFMKTLDSLIFEKDF